MVIRGLLVHALKSTTKDAANVPADIVYAHPTISLLSRELSRRAIGGAHDEPSGVDDKVRYMEAIVSDLTRDLGSSTMGTKSLPISETLLVTGTTGSLGTEIVAHLLNAPSIARIYAVNRGTFDSGVADGVCASMRARQEKSFKRQGHSESLSRSDKIIYLEGDASLPYFGLDDTTRDDILSSLTCIIHAGASHLIIT